MEQRRRGRFLPLAGALDFCSMSAAPPTTPKAIVSAAAAEPAAPPWLRQVALLTGVLAALGGFLTVRSTSLSNDAIYNSTQAVLLQAQASDKWAEYQADSIKAHVAQTQLDVVPPSQTGRERLQSDFDQYNARKSPLMADAQKLEDGRDQQLKNGRKLLGEKDVLGYAGMAGQLAIALASVAALTRRKEAFIAALCFGAFAIAVTGYAMAMHYFFTNG
jgi:hypothetical protein